MQQISFFHPQFSIFIKKSLYIQILQQSIILGIPSRSNDNIIIVVQEYSHYLHIRMITINSISMSMMAINFFDAVLLYNITVIEFIVDICRNLL